MMVDQLGSTFEPKNYERIVSIVPSQTELLYDLGLGDRVVGITKFCVHPKAWFNTKSRVGGTKTVSIEKVAQLQPDLIIGNKEENDRENIEALSKIAPVWMSDIYTLDDSLEMVISLGKLLAVEKAATDLEHQIRKAFSDIHRSSVSPTCLYLIWRNPYMAVGSNTFIDHILCQELGFENTVKEKSRYPEVELNEMKEKPDYIFLSSEPYPFREVHIAEIQKLFPSSKIVLVNGEYFSWYGSRLLEAPRYFNQLINRLEDSKFKT